MKLQIDPQVAYSVVQASPKQPSHDKAKDLKQLRKSTREFEAMYLNEVYKSMRKNVPDDGLFKKSFSTKMFQEMLDMEMARKAADGDGIGIGKAMYDQLKGNVR